MAPSLRRSRFTSESLDRIRQARSTPRPGRALADFPGLMAQWHPTRNSHLDRTTLCRYTSTPVWWLCSFCGYEFEMAPESRTETGGCRNCRGHRAGKAAARDVPGPGESLGDRHPYLVSEWHPTLNEELTPFNVKPGSQRIVQWQCALGHTWPATPGNRTHVTSPTGCPDCTIYRTSVEEIRLRCELMAAGFPVDVTATRIKIPDLNLTLMCDIVCPAWELIVEFDGYRYHRRPNALRTDQKKTAALTAAGWTVIRVREALPLVSAADVWVALRSSELTRAKAVLSKAHTLGFIAPYHDRYQQSVEPWARAAAHAEIERLRADPLQGESLACCFPDVAAEWHPTRNEGLTPNSIRPGHQPLRWWLCQTCGFEWSASPSNRTHRTHPTGCPQCSKLPKPGTSLAERRPDVAAEWHPTRNGDLSPYTVSYGSDRAAWWLCSLCGSEFQKRISTRRYGPGCPTCGRQRAVVKSTERIRNSRRKGPRRPVPGRSLADHSPDIAAEWHPELNDALTAYDVSPRSNHLAWWLCSLCGKDFSKRVAARNGVGCSDCGTARALRKLHERTAAPVVAPKPGQSLRELRPDLAAIWHPQNELTPAQVTLGCSVTVWWLCDRGHEWRATPNSVARSPRNGCRKCYRIPEQRNSFAYTFPAMAAQWHPALNDFTPDTVTGGSNRKAWWLCPDCGHKWEASIANRTRHGSGCPPCGAKRAWATRNRAAS